MKLGKRFISGLTHHHCHFSNERIVTLKQVGGTRVQHCCNQHFNVLYVLFLRNKYEATNIEKRYRHTFSRALSNSLSPILPTPLPRRPHPILWMGSELESATLQHRKTAAQKESGTRAHAYTHTHTKGKIGLRVRKKVRMAAESDRPHVVTRHLGVIY